MSNLLTENADAWRLRFRERDGEPDDQVFDLRAFVRSLTGSSTVTKDMGDVAPTAPAGSDEEPRIVAPELEELVEAEATASSSGPPHPSAAIFDADRIPEVDSFWGIDGGIVPYADDDDASLSAQFFTQTTHAQEEGIRTVRGLQVVHGVAGSGKTSVAMGRLKFFANFRSLENLDEYGLEERDFADFDPAAMIGFVLSPSLVSYLKQTAESLEIGAMKIQDFGEFLNSERSSRRVFNTRPFKKSSAPGHQSLKSVRWLRVLDAVAATYVRDGMMAIEAEGLQRPMVEGASRIDDARWSQIVEAYWTMGTLAGRRRALIDRVQGETSRFALKGLAQEIDRGVRMGDREAKDLGGDELRVLRSAVENVQQRLLRLLNPQELYLQAMTEPTYFAQTIQRAKASGLPEAPIVAIGERLAKNEVTEEDAICALCLNALACDGFTREIRAIPYLASFAERVGVFIDEYQDFSELQVLLMGYKARPRYWLVTVAGDPSQRLHEDGLAEVQNAFPQIANRQQSILLDRNMRQAGAMASLSSCFRALTETGEVIDVAPCGAPVDVFEDRREFAELAVGRILALPETASVAVICANEGEVDRWFALMHDALEDGFRQPARSDKSELTRRFVTHFTTPLEAKGLEFDAVIVPDVSAFDGESAVGRNSLYVAVSRPRRAILLGCHYETMAGSTIAKLIDEGHLSPRTVSMTTVGTLDDVDA